MLRTILGIDVGASGIKGALVDTETGELLAPRERLVTPQPATPMAMGMTVKELIKLLDYDGPAVGVGFPSIVQHGTARSAANIDKSWIGASVEDSFGEATGRQIYALNDADAAGLASYSFGIGKNMEGVTLFLTLGTGIGSALFVDGTLVPNTELGHVYLKGMKIVAEKYAANSIRKRDKLSFEEWGKRLNQYLHHVDRLLTPDQIILGGGVCKKFNQYKEYLDCRPRVVAAELRNEAGIVGAAMYASIMHKKRMSSALG